MALNVEEQIQFRHGRITRCENILNQPTGKLNYQLININGSTIADSYFSLGLLYWRMKQNPTEYFQKVIHTALDTHARLKLINAESAALNPYDPHVTPYVAYLINLPHAPVRLKPEDNHTLAAVFFGNVLLGAADIADWPKYRGALPEGKKYDLARETNELYAGLLAGQISPEEGVKMGEALWKQRRNRDYYSGCGNGKGNDEIVDYKLGAILKKIGSSVPTVHAWIW